MSRREAVVLASRTLAVLLTTWVLVSLSYLPTEVVSLVHHPPEAIPSAANLYWRHYYSIQLSFAVVRIIGLSLFARWLFRCGPEVEEALLPAASRDDDAALN